MIVKMKKVTLLCREAERDEALRALQQVGVLHLEHIRDPEGADLEAARNRLRDVRLAANLLEEFSGELTPIGKPTEPVEEVVGNILQLAGRIKSREEELSYWKREVEKLEPFGNFDPSDVRAMREQGVDIRLYRAGRKQFETISGNFIIREFQRDKDSVYFAVIARGEIDIAGEEIQIPAHSLDTAKHTIRELNRLIESDRRTIAGYTLYGKSVRKFLQSIDDNVQFFEAREGLGIEQSLIYLRGFCPVRDVEELRRASAANGWGLLVEEPGDTDRIPTKIENPSWVRPIKPVLQFIGVVPGYREVDISTVFLLFFSLFFAMIVGDAGYGLVFLGLTYFGRKKFPDKPKLVFTLLYVMSIGTIIWGMLTGQYFGVNDLLPAPLEILRIDWLTDQDNIMFLCFLIGAIHLTIAHGWNVIRYLNTTVSLAHLGWIMTTWTMFFLARNMVIGHEFPAIMYYVLAAGVLFIVLFMTPVRRIKIEWFNHAMLPLNLVGNFVDVISYIRLFAVGMATYAVGNAFNEIALDIGFGNIFAGLGASLLLFFAHTLNILLAIMGVLVHGIRLNTLEFATHLGMQWTGTEYRPFAHKADSES